MKKNDGKKKIKQAFSLLFPGFVLVLMLSPIGCAAQAQSQQQSATIVAGVNGKEARDLLQQHRSDADFVILDVRTPDEYRQGKISGAVNLDLHSPTFAAEVAKLNKDKTYFVYCRSGKRSSHAVKIMTADGINKIYHLDGGIRQWMAENLPIE